MKRTQLYLEEDLWEALRIRSRQEHTTVSELVRRAVRDRYLKKAAERHKAMSAIIGLWKDRADIGDSTEYVRMLRRDRRSKALRS